MPRIDHVGISVADLDAMTEWHTRGYGHVCLRVDDSAVSDDALVSAGATSIMSPRPARRADARLAYVADPEGNLVELIDRDIPT